MDRKVKVKANSEILKDFPPQGTIIPWLISLMLKVNTNDKEAKLNSTSISDNNGGRIML